VARIDTRNTVRYWVAPHIEGLSCLHADFTTHSYAPHSHDGFVIAVTEVGGASFKSRGQVDEATAGTLLVFNPDEPHSGWMGQSTRWRYRSLYLDPQAIAFLSRCLGMSRPVYFTRNTFSDPALIAAFRHLHETLDDGHGGDDRELLVGCFGALCKAYADGGARIRGAPASNAAVRRVIAYMRNEYPEKLTLERLSAHAGLTPFQLIGLFKRSVGLTPHAYLTQVRLRAALRELRRGATPTEAALAVGFYDQSAFTNHLKRSYGITPLQYLQSLARTKPSITSLPHNFHQ
jgi:AraC-like DNA-binding protein